MDVTKQDKITIAIDKCNAILNELGLCVGEVIPVNEEEYQKTKDKYSLYNGKLYTNETIKKMKNKGSV